MLTLTVSSNNYPDHAAAAADLKRGLIALRLRLERHPTYSNFDFIAVFEKHKSGWPHLHLLITGEFIPWWWLKRSWQEITGSTGIDIRRIYGGKDAARYVAKYLGKDLSLFPGSKRYWRSHGYPRPDNDDDEAIEQQKVWGRTDANFNLMAQRAHEWGWTVKSEGDYRWAFEKPPGDHRGWRELIDSVRNQWPPPKHDPEFFWKGERDAAQGW